MHKNRLQEFAQRYNIALPLYQSNNEGQQHAPRFRSKVWVDGMSYISQSTFSHRKTAEQDAARLALKCLSKRTRDEAPSLDCELSSTIAPTHQYKMVLGFLGLYREVFFTSSDMLIIDLNKP
ncbi:hypothetical protein PHAVU_011G009300 [Phaseolus vulgaris]|uniref:DRBM domain-containing protein n=1 Tax=Phaseolus vulgaris TaxID=3885 RepID=V7ADR6_PHAVU|nr:hypothetical protein PHAVU_011G0093000g [Phaseolus vulgaris]ESW03380.1 hypothetical protein PHAVU_011G0093000g [Phaseolus vulgaris]